MAGETKELLRASDLCPRLGVSTGRVYQLIADGIIPHVRVGNAIRIPRQAWEAWLATQNRVAETSLAAAGGAQEEPGGYRLTRTGAAQTLHAEAEHSAPVEG